MKLSKHDLRKLIQEVKEHEESKIEKADEVATKAQAQGLEVSKFDANSLITSLVGGVGGALNLSQVGKPLAYAIDGTLLIKTLYDASQSMNALSKLNRSLKPIVGRDLISNFIFDAIAPVTEEELMEIASAPSHIKDQLRRYAISTFQYHRRAIVSLLGALPGIVGGEDIALAAMSITISTAPVPETIIAVIQAMANISDQFPGLHKMAQEETFVGKCIRLIVNPASVYTVGMIMTALGILDPGTGDKLHQYVSLSGATRSDVLRDIQRADKKAQDDQVNFEKEMASSTGTITPGQNLLSDDTILEYSSKRMQLLAGIK